MSQITGLPTAAPSDFQETIDEFPQFSYVLGDMHPHVLALPFAVLAIGLGLNLVLMWRRLHLWEFVLYAIFVGGMVRGSVSMTKAKKKKGE